MHMKYTTLQKRLDERHLHIKDVNGGKDIKTENGDFVAFLGTERPFHLTVSPIHYEIDKQLFHSLQAVAATDPDKR